jgi:hypothetical protein
MSDSAPTEPTPAVASPDGGQPGRPSRNRVALIAAIVVIVALVGVIAVVLLTRDDSTSTTAGTSTTTTTTAPETTTTTEATTTTTETTTTLPDTPPDTSTAVWPYVSSPTRYTDPVDAARGFAVDFVGFVDPVVGEFQAGDTRSGEVEIRPNATGPVTTVMVRQLSGSDTWWVLGSATGNIVVDTPDASATISSPVSVHGTSTAFEATVSVEVREDGNRNAIGQGTVMGGSMGEMGPFDGSIPFSATAPHGALLFFTLSAENGQVWEATAFPVQFTSS